MTDLGGTPREQLAELLKQAAIQHGGGSGPNASPMWRARWQEAWAAFLEARGVTVAVDRVSPALTVSALLKHADDCPSRAAHQGMCTCWPERDLVLSASISEAGRILPTPSDHAKTQARAAFADFVADGADEMDAVGAAIDLAFQIDGEVGRVPAPPEPPCDQLADACRELWGVPAPRAGEAPTRKCGSCGSIVREVATERIGFSRWVCDKCNLVTHEGEASPTPDLSPRLERVRAVLDKLTDETLRNRPLLAACLAVELDVVRGRAGEAAPEHHVHDFRCTICREPCAYMPLGGEQ